MFSKACYLIALNKLPSASETPRILYSHAFALHIIPKEIFSHHGPQFISQVWKEFCTTLRAISQLTSGYYPQTNGQCKYLSQELENASVVFVPPVQLPEVFTEIEYAQTPKLLSF